MDVTFFAGYVGAGNDVLPLLRGEFAHGWFAAESNIEFTQPERRAWLLSDERLGSDI